MFFESLRWVGQVGGVATFVCIYIYQIALRLATDPSNPQQDDERLKYREHFALRVIAAAFFAEFTIYAGTLWFVRSDRSIPLMPLIYSKRWGGRFFSALSRFCFQHRTFHHVLVLSFLTSLVLIVGNVGGYSSSGTLARIAYGLYMILYLIDGEKWYPLIQLGTCLLAFAIFPPATTSRAEHYSLNLSIIQVIHCGVYLHAGLAKLLNIKRVTHCSGWMFSAIEDFLRLLAYPCGVRRRKSSDGDEDYDGKDEGLTVYRLRCCLVGVCVFGEFFVGAMYGFFSFAPASLLSSPSWAPTFRFLMDGTLYGHLCMHVYIFSYVGCYWGVYPIVSWNAASAAITLSSFPLVFAKEASAWGSLHSIVFLLVTLSFIVYGFSCYIGRATIAELAFTYYSHWSGDEVLIVPKSAVGTYDYPKRGGLPINVRHNKIRLHIWSSDNDAQTEPFPPYSATTRLIQFDQDDEPIPGLTTRASLARTGSYSWFLDQIAAPVTPSDRQIFQGYGFGLSLSELARKLELPGATAAAEEEEGATELSQEKAKEILMKYTVAIGSDWSDVELEYGAEPRTDGWTYYGQVTSLFYHRLVHEAIRQPCVYLALATSTIWGMTSSMELIHPGKEEEEEEAEPRGQHHHSD